MFNTVYYSVLFTLIPRRHGHANFTASDLIPTPTAVTLSGTSGPFSLRWHGLYFFITMVHDYDLENFYVYETGLLPASLFFPTPLWVGKSMVTQAKPHITSPDG